MANTKQDYRLQQEILRNIQRSSSQWDPKHPTLVHISPATTGGTSDDGNLVFTFAAREDAPNTSSSPTMPTPSVSDSTPQGASNGSPAPPNGTFHPPVAVGTNATDPNNSRIQLSDGTQILLNRSDQIVLNGPTGLQMTINCLPLYKLPDGYAIQSSEASSSSKNTPCSPQEVNQPLHMAASAPSLPSIFSTPSRSLSTQLKCSTLPPLEASSEEVDWGVDDGSDTDENKCDDDNLSIKYVTTQDAVPSGLMRSSGSVSFSRVNEFKPIAATFPTISEGEGAETTSGEQSGEEGNTQVLPKVDSVRQGPTTVGRTPPQIPMPYSRRLATRISTVLPTPPPCVEPQYMERSGWLTKLSHRKGVFGDRWQKRYFVLHQAQLLYFKKYGDAKPKGRILLLPGGWCKAVSQGTPRMADALLNSASNNGPPPVVTVLRCMAIHRPSNPARSLSALLVTEGVADAFSSQTVIVNTPEQSSRTFYVTTSSNEERNSWIAAVQHNLEAYVRSPEALRTACIELQSMLCAVSCKLPESTIPSLLTLLYLKMQALSSQHP